MKETTKTTVYLDAQVYRTLQEIAREEGRPAAMLIREAAVEYVASRKPRPKPASIGVVRSKRGNLAERAEKLLRGFGEER